MFANIYLQQLSHAFRSVFVRGSCPAIGAAFKADLHLASIGQLRHNMGVHVGIHIAVFLELPEDSASRRMPNFYNEKT